MPAKPTRRWPDRFRKDFALGGDGDRRALLAEVRATAATAAAIADEQTRQHHRRRRKPVWPGAGPSAEAHEWRLKMAAIAVAAANASSAGGAACRQ